MTGTLFPAVPGVEIQPTALIVRDPSLPFETFSLLVVNAATVGDAARWWIGDLLLFGSERYGEEYAQVLDGLQISERQAVRYRYVCERVRPGRRKNLSFSHHEEVAALEPGEQTRLLEQAVGERWTTGELREKARELKTPKPVSKPEPRRPEVIEAGETIDAARNLSVARGHLAALEEKLEPATAEAAGIPATIRAIDDAGATVKRAVASGALLDAARRAVREATKSSGFAMIPSEVFDQLAAAVAATEGGS